MTSPARIRQADLERIFKAAKRADVQVRVEVEPEGKLVILPIRDGDSQDANDPGRWE